ncbi:MAG TPA: acyltransferase family protein [Acidimicrobiales bacterium]|nr:acyltransferase family protein [Acidimicrobiales bacterium]
MRERSRVGPIDGLRGLALVAVLLYHVAPGTVRGGFLGVESFFVLSGYLLTALLLDEHRRTGTIDRLAYGTRRVRRIYPGMIALLVALVVFVPLLDYADSHRLPLDVLASLFGVINWRLIADGASYFAHLGNPSYVRHLWSIAIELQFYLLCPFIVGWLAGRRLKVAAGALVAGIAASATLMALLYQSPDPSRAYYGTDTRIGALLAGCLVAVLLSRGGDAIGPRFRTTASQIGAPVALAVLLALFIWANETSRLLYPAGFLLTQAATGTIIAVALRPGWLTEGLAHRLPRWLGRRSYGIYLWHWPLVVLTLHWSSRVTAGVVTITSAVILGALSYGLIEKRFMHAPQRRVRVSLVARRARTVAVLSTVAVAVVLLARVPATDPIAHSLQVGQRALANQVSAPAAGSVTVPTVTPTLPTGAAAPATTAAAAARPPPTTPPTTPPPIPVIAIGDSVMVGAAPALQARLGSSGYIDAHIGRQFDDGVHVAQSFRDGGRLGRAVVVHLGDNGAITPQEVDALIGDLAGVPNVLLVNVRVTKPWQDEVNQTLADAVARHPGVKLVDWFNYSAPHGDWFAGDRTHLNETGSAAFADFIVGAIPPPPPPPTAAPTTTTTVPPPPVTTVSGPPSPG